VTDGLPGIMQYICTLTLMPNKCLAQALTVGGDSNRWEPERSFLLSKQ